MKKNWCYTIKEGPHAGKTLWSGRYCAIVALVFCKFNGVWKVLANKRGKGTPDFQGYWNCPCGFLEANESAEEGCSREVYEETGLFVDPSKFILVGVETDPKTCNNGNVTLRYSCVIDNAEEVKDNLSKLKGGEVDEVEEIKWIPITDINMYNWAFGHEYLIYTFK